jgi:SAM-dependent methyltransferase
MSNDLHNQEIQRNRRVWQKKAILRRVYGQFYERIAGELSTDVPGLTVELGSGIGAVKEFIPNCVTTDIFPNPWLDRTENAYKLNFPDKAVANLVILDVLHHLEYPGSAFQEFHRVLADEGRIIIFEPAMGFLGRLVFGLFHREPIACGDEINWVMRAEKPINELRYFAAQGNAWRLFREREKPQLFDHWQVKSITYFHSLAYLASGGFSSAKFLPDYVLRVLLQTERPLRVFTSLLATRMLVVLTKKHAG